MLNNEKCKQAFAENYFSFKLKDKDSTVCLGSIKVNLYLCQYQFVCLVLVFLFLVALIFDFFDFDALPFSPLSLH